MSSVLRLWLIPGALTLSPLSCGGQTSDRHNAVVDGSTDSSIDAPSDARPFQLASFALLFNGTPQTPMTCPGADWEYAPPTNAGTSVAIMNTGSLPMPYLAQRLWAVGSHYVPGATNGDPRALIGVLAPGAQVDITSVYAGGAVALVGNAAPFSSADASYAADDGTIPWPNGVAGSGGATTMNIAEIEVPTVPAGCQSVFQAW